MGPGWALGMGHIIGVSAAWEGWSGYVPIRHPDSECRPRHEVTDWVEWLLRNNHVVFHNMGYDMGWLRAEGVNYWPLSCDDTQNMAVMLNENEFEYNLDACCVRAGILGKDETLLHSAMANLGVARKDTKANLWRLPARFVGPYAEQDAVATLQLAEHLRPKLEAEHLEEAYRLEMDLVPMVHDMRQRGIPVNTETAARVQMTVRTKCEQALAEIGRLSGRSVSIDDCNSPEALAKIFDQFSIPYGRTAKTGQPSFTKDFLEDVDHPVGKLVRLARQNHDLSEKFIGNYILGYEHRGRLHAEIHQLRDDDGGTRTYRISYANPPLQQMPARDPILGPLTRSIFEPERGERWGALDYSQQEPRLAVHYAALTKRHGADEAVAYYRDRADADFHQMVADMAGIDRWSAKIINLGMMYGMGAAKLARSLGLSLEEGQALLAQYHANVPWVKGLTDFCSSAAQRRGYIRLLDGARCRFDRWQPAWGRSGYALSHARALDEWSGKKLERAYTHKAMNRLVQGGAARQTKKAMLACYREGHLPMIQMHDELDFSFSRHEDAQRCTEIMTNVVQLVIPTKVDAEYGRNWGSAKYDWDKVAA
jgi:DNA polymerase I-like protein with 3'-5' exonuclease and polymerase domains